MVAFCKTKHKSSRLYNNPHIRWENPHYTRVFGRPNTVAILSNRRHYAQRCVRAKRFHVSLSTAYQRVRKRCTSKKLYKDHFNKHKTIVVFRLCVYASISQCLSTTEEQCYRWWRECCSGVGGVGGDGGDDGVVMVLVAGRRGGTIGYVLVCLQDVGVILGHHRCHLRCACEYFNGERWSCCNCDRHTV